MRKRNRALLVFLSISLGEIKAQQLRSKQPAICGDGVCQNGEEDCETCPGDCCAKPTDDDDFVRVVVQEYRKLNDIFPGNFFKICSSGPNQPLPCEDDTDCGMVCTLNPTQLCNVDEQCNGEDNLCSIIENSCETYVSSTSEPSSSPSESIVPTNIPTMVVDTAEPSLAFSFTDTEAPSVVESTEPSFASAETDAPTSFVETEGPSFLLDTTGPSLTSVETNEPTLLDTTGPSLTSVETNEPTLLLDTTGPSFVSMETEMPSLLVETNGSSAVQSDAPSSGFVDDDTPSVLDGTMKPSILLEETDEPSVLDTAVPTVLATNMPSSVSSATDMPSFFLDTDGPSMETVDTFEPSMGDSIPVSASSSSNPLPIDSTSSMPSLGMVESNTPTIISSGPSSGTDSFNESVTPTIVSSMPSSGLDLIAVSVTPTIATSSMPSSERVFPTESIVPTGASSFPSVSPSSTATAKPNDKPVSSSPATSKEPTSLPMEEPSPGTTPKEPAFSLPPTSKKPTFSPLSESSPAPASKEPSKKPTASPLSEFVPAPTSNKAASTASPQLPVTASGEKLPRNYLKVCSSGPNQALPCEQDVDCGKVCSGNPTQVCNADAQCAGEENLCSEIEESCTVFALTTSAPTLMPSVSEMPSFEPSAGTNSPSLQPSASSIPSSVPSASPKPSASLNPSRAPSSVPSSEPSISAQPSKSSSPSSSPSKSLLPSVSPSVMPSSQPTLTFFALGNVPFSKQEQCMIPYELKKLRNSGLGGRFLIHLGDIRDTYVNQTRPCPEFLFTNLTATFSSSPVETFFIPGERGWLDCPNPNMAYGFAQDHLFSFSERNDLGWPQFPANVSRHENRTELFSFLLEDILFLGQSLPGRARNSSVESKLRDQLLTDNGDWTEQVFADNFGLYKAVVVFANDFLTPINEGYMQRFLSIATKSDYVETPILLLQNGESYKTSTTDVNATNVLWARTDDTVSPLAITVDPWANDLKDIFLFDRRCYCTFGHRPTRMKEYLPWDKCAGVCSEAQLQCGDLPGCSPPGNTC